MMNRIFIRFFVLFVNITWNTYTTENKIRDNTIYMSLLSILEEDFGSLLLESIDTNNLCIKKNMLSWEDANKKAFTYNPFVACYFKRQFLEDKKINFIRIIEEVNYNNQLLVLLLKYKDKPNFFQGDFIDEYRASGTNSSYYVCTDDNYVINAPEELKEELKTEILKIMFKNKKKDAIAKLKEDGNYAVLIEKMENLYKKHPLNKKRIIIPSVILGLIVIIFIFIYIIKYKKKGKKSHYRLRNPKTNLIIQDESEH